MQDDYTLTCEGELEVKVRATSPRDAVAFANLCPWGDRDEPDEEHEVQAECGGKITRWKVRHVVSVQTEIELVEGE